jgi:phage tail sheath protein FI
MAEYLSAGVFIEEVPAAVQTIQAVSTSTLGIVGFSPQGPTDAATLVTSFPQYQQMFGGFTANSFMPLSVAAFFSNGGQQAYVVRVMPSNAVMATGGIQSQINSQALAEEPTGTLLIFSKSNSPAGPAPITNLDVNAGASPIIPGSVQIRWRAVGMSSTAIPLVARDGQTVVVPDGVKTNFELRLPVSDFSGTSSDIFDEFGNPTDPLLPCVEAASTVNVTVQYKNGVTSETLIFPGTAAGLIVTASNSGQVSGTFDRITGFMSLSFTTAPPSLSSLTASYTKLQNSTMVSDDRNGNLVGSGVIDPTYVAIANTVGANQISYTGGGYNFKVLIAVAPSNGTQLLITYQIQDWAMSPVSKGVWANGLEVSVTGNVDSYSVSEATYSAYDVDVLLYDSSSASYLVQETYSGLVFDDPTSAYYFSDVINSLSSYLTVTTPGGNSAPNQLSGTPQSCVIAGGDGSVAGKIITTEATAGPVQPRTFSLSFTGVSLSSDSIVDDGLGNLTGSVDPTYTTTVIVGGISVGPNKIDYASGSFNVKLSEAIAPNSLAVLSTFSAPSSTTYTGVFGTTASGYTAGSDGTFTSATWSALQFTDPSLQLPFKGLYALDRVDDILQVVIPDFAGDLVVTSGLLAYAQTHASQPSGGDRFIILTVPKGSTPQQAVNYFRYTLAQYSSYAAIYWPWIKVANPLQNNRALTIPPMGHVAGVYARTDNNRNVGKAPAGTVDGQLTFLLGLEYNATRGEMNLVYPNRINPIISNALVGTAVWGVRTISSDPQWLYVNARRLFMFLEKSVYNSTQWTVFENNGPPLWTRISLQLSSFLLGLFNDGYFAGNTPKDAFFVTVDNTNNTAASINQGQVIVDVGAAPNKPAEFIRFRFQQVALS